MNIKIANEVLSRMFQSLVGEEIATLGFEYINGTLKSLEPLRKLLTKYSDDFLPNFEIEWDNIDIPHLLEMSELESKWKFNIPSLRNRVEGISGGHLIFIGARPNTGKTSSHAYLLAGPGGFAEQGAKCIVLTNEESYHRVGSRYACAGTNMTLEEIKADRDNAMNIYKKVRRNVEIKDASGEDMDYVELAAMRYRPDILVLDMGDKFASKSSDRTDLYLRDAAIHARNIAKKYNCAIFWMSQLSAEAEGKIVPNMSMMEGSKTGKAAEADLMLLISRNTVVEGKDDEDPQRHITVAKNKLSGWHGVIHCELDAKRVQFNA